MIICLFKKQKSITCNSFFRVKIFLSWVLLNEYQNVFTDGTSKCLCQSPWLRACAKCHKCKSRWGVIGRRNIYLCDDEFSLFLWNTHSFDSSLQIQRVPFCPVTATSVPFSSCTCLSGFLLWHVMGTKANSKCSGPPFNLPMLLAVCAVWRINPSVCHHNGGMTFGKVMVHLQN